MDYKRFLIGVKSGDEYAKLDYDNITMDLNDYVLDAFLVKQLEDSDLDQIEEDNNVSEDNGEDIKAKINTQMRDQYNDKENIISTIHVDAIFFC